MKKLLLITVIVLTSLISFSQDKKEIKYSELIEGSKGSYDSYTSKDGLIFNVGDKIKIGKPSNGSYFNYVQDYPNGALNGIAPASASLGGTETKIKKISVFGNKRQGYQVWLSCKGACGLCGDIRIQLENAISNFEIRTNQKTSDEALVELKKAKDKLDLGLITQQKFDSLKMELSKYIK